MRSIHVLAAVLVVLGVPAHAAPNEGASVQVFTEEGLGLMSADGDRFGTAMVTADFNCDGFDDLAIGAPFASPGVEVEAGQVIVLWGDPSSPLEGPPTVLTEDSIFGVGNTEAFDHFGFALAAGDTDADDCDDLVIGTPGEDESGLVEMGAAYLLRGAMTGFEPMATRRTFEQSDATFGYAVAVGDFDLDGLGDLAVGGPGINVGDAQGAGQVSIYHAGALTADQTWHRDRVLIPGQAAAGERFGAGLATGRFVEGPFGFDSDLAIGVPGDSRIDVLGGAVDLLFGVDFFGLGVLPGRNYNADFAVPQCSGAAPGNEMGSVLLAANLVDDERDELVVGVPRGDTGPNGTFVDAGSVHVVRFFVLSNGQLFIGGPVFCEEEMNGVLTPGGRFGASLATASSPDPARDSILVGKTGDVAGTGGLVYRGLIRLFLEQFEMPSLMIQGVAGLPETAELGDGFGSALAVGRFDGLTEFLAIGIPFEDREPQLDRGAVMVIEGADSPLLFADGFESGDFSAWSLAPR